MFPVSLVLAENTGRCSSSFLNQRQSSPPKTNSKKNNLLEETSDNSLEKRIGYEFKDPDLRRIALAHRGQRKSYRFSGKPLEFLGDAVFNLSAFDILMRLYPYTEIKKINEEWGSFVRNDVQADLASSFKMDEDIRLDKYLRNSMINNLPLRHRRLANFLEALVGLVYLDGGYAEARSFVERLIKRKMKEVLNGNYRDLSETHSNIHFPLTSQMQLTHFYNSYIKRFEFLGHYIFNLCTIDIFMQKSPRAKAEHINKKQKNLRDSITFSHLNSLGQSARLRVLEMGTALHSKSVKNTLYFLLGAVYSEEGYNGARALVLYLIEEINKNKPVKDNNELSNVFAQQQFQTVPEY